MSEETSRPPESPPQRPEGEGDEAPHNEIGYRNVSETAEHDERGSQSDPPGAGAADERP